MSSSGPFSLQLAQLLPMEENFLLLFRFDNPLESSVEFMKVSNREGRRQGKLRWDECDIKTLYAADEGMGMGEKVIKIALIDSISRFTFMTDLARV